MRDEPAPFSQAERELRQRVDQPEDMPRHAFTLVELSIVLVIIALLASVVFIGRELVQQASLRRVITEYNQYTVAVNSFRQKYNALPGDIVNPARYGLTGTSLHPSTSGNGNGLIRHERVSGSYETYTAWFELHNAGLVEFAPTIYSTNEDKAGVTVPASSFN